MRTEGCTAARSQTPNLVDEARTAIWRLFQEGYVDEDMATAGLLAVDLGTRRKANRPSPPDPLSLSQGEGEN